MLRIKAVGLRIIRTLATDGKPPIKNAPGVKPTPTSAGTITPKPVSPTVAKPTHSSISKQPITETKKSPIVYPPKSQSVTASKGPATPKPLSAVTKDSPYRVNEYYGHNIYSFVDLGAKMRLSKLPQPNPY